MPGCMFGHARGQEPRGARRCCEKLGLEVNRLIRISFGPFMLGDLPRGGVEEVKPRVLRDQLGGRLPSQG